MEIAEVLRANNIRYKELNKLSGYLSNLYGIRKYEFSEETDADSVKEIVKNWMKFIFTTNLIIVHSKSANAIRHFFPKNDGLEEDFFHLLKSAFKVINIDISKKEENPARPNERTYFYFQNYKSIMRFLLYCDGEPPLLDKLNKIKDIFLKSEVYIFFTEDFMGQIFKEKGIINQNNLTITKFFTEILKISSYKRHSFYRWREEKYLPVQVVLQLKNLEIFNQNYDTNFFKYISSIKFGKTKSEEKFEKKFLVEIKNNYKEIILNLFPQTESNLGNFLNLIFSLPKIEYERRNLLPLFDEFISNYDLPDHKEVNLIVKEIRRRLLNPETDVILKSLTLKNFKSYDEEVIDFEDGINIFYGPNGSGKTTLIEAIFFSLFHLEVEFNMHLRQTYDYESLPIIGPVAETIPISFIYPKVNVIQKNKKFCRVILELLKGDNPITIKREVWRSGQQELSINGNDILKNIREKLEFIKLIKNSEEKEINFEDKLLLINKKKGEISLPVNSEFDYDFLYDELSSHVILQEIHKSYGEYGMYFDIEEIYASFNNTYRFIDSVSIEDSINLDYYNRFFGLNYIIDTIKHYIEGLGKNETLIGQDTSLLYAELNFQNIFPKINYVDEEIFKTGKIGDKCISCEKTFDDARDFLIYYVCQKCGSIYCGECAIVIRSKSCEVCDEDIDYIKFLYRIFDVDDFYNLLKLKGFYKGLEVEKGLEIIAALGIPYLIGAYLNDWPEFLLEDIHSIQLKTTIKKIIHQYEDFILEIKEGTLEDLSYYTNNPSLNILFTLAKKLLNENYESKSLEDDVVLFLAKIKSGIKTTSNKIINFIILNELKKCYKKIDKSFLKLNPLEEKALELHWNSLKKEIDDINEVNIDGASMFEGWKPFEIRQINLLIKLIHVMEPFFFDSQTENLVNFLTEISYSSDYDKQKIEDVKKGIPSEKIEELLLDYKILVNRMRNQLHIIEKITFNNEMIKNFISTLKFDENFLIILKDIYSYLFKLKFEIAQSMYKEESKSNFGHTDISSFIDDSGSLKIIYKNSEEIYPFENLSGGERSKFLLILVSILIKMSNKNSFYLIDEPNELIDPLNIDDLKKTLYNLFSNKQIVICTFIENYKKFKPALIHQVNKGSDGISRLERVSPEPNLPDFKFSLEYFNNLKTNFQEKIKIDEFEKFGEFTTRKTDKMEIKFTGFDETPMISINSDDNNIKGYLSNQFLSQLSNLIFRGNSMISGVTGSGKTSLIKRYLAFGTEEPKFGRLIIDVFGEYKEVAKLIGRGKNIYQIIDKVPTNSEILEFNELILNSNTLFLDISPLEPVSQNEFLIKLFTAILSYRDDLKSEDLKAMIFLEDMGFTEDSIEVIEKFLRTSRKFNISLTLVTQRILEELVPFMDTFISFKTTNNKDINILLNISFDFSSENFKKLKNGQFIVNSMFLTTSPILTLNIV